MVDGQKNTPTPVNEAAQKSAQGMGIASLVLGILAVLTVFTGIGGIIGLILAIIGWVLGAKARRILPPESRGMATAGWICSIIAVGMCILGLLVLLVLGGGLLLG